MTPIKILLAILLLAFSPLSLAIEQSFYILRTYTPSQISSNKNAIDSLNHHFKKINILISQAYRVDKEGKVSGGVDPKVFAFAKQHSLKLMVLITNVGFDKDKAHYFLTHPAAQKKAMAAILTACQQNHYYGVQFDFEGISIKDSRALTKFYLSATEILHQHGFHVSFAVIPLVGEAPYATSFLKRKYENWGGVYDLQKLGDKSDFITIMSYDQHEQGTAPGPTASISWVEATIKHTLKFVPAQKVSLGIAVYSAYWYTGNNSGSSTKRITLNLADMNYEQVNSLIKKRDIKLTWDKNNKINYAIYLHNWLNEYLFVEDSQSFKAKIQLAKQYKLRGVSVFSLGNEDPRIWNTLATK
ncbi:MAG: hypothetical protein A3F11_10355 [Gammaproteobacteria bacterium RIFCSPHIGHO2_12_FULL_37_14]|nr:MAG: hypothetical protein A3F11_10355 [Gammaproteobacteria bacterium RIFCSPHIGHO2_12_FULL_37_14]